MNSIKNFTKLKYFAQEDDNVETETDLYVMIICIILILYVLFQSVIEHKKITLIHETGLGILLGVLFGFVLYEEAYITEFSGEFFFIYILPPIIFAGGYNLKKDKFFKNIFYIVLYAVIGTIINFLITLLIMGLINQSGAIYTMDGTQVIMNDASILYFASTMCASDAIAAITLISSDKYPKLFSIVFGEGLINDAVAIILFHSVAKIAGGSSASISTKDAFNMIWNFFSTCLASVSLGLAIGFLVTYLFKKCRFIYHNSVTENVLILLSGYMVYVMSEALGQSGVITLLTCGILMSHYLVYNLSPTGQISSAITLQTISQVAEGFLFVYLGITFWFYFSPEKFDDTSMGFIGYGFLAVIIARFFCIFVTSGIAKLIMRKSWKLNILEVSIVWFAGLIRGAVAFALIQTVELECSLEDLTTCIKQNQILKSSIMAIVFFTTIVLGAFMPCYVKWHIKKIEQMEYIKSQSEFSEAQQPFIQDQDKDGQEQQEEEDEKEKFSKQKAEKIKKKYKNGCIRMFKMLDENFIKPFFIYDYNNRKIEIDEQKKLLKMQYSENDNNQKIKTLTRIQNNAFKNSHIGSSYVNNNNKKENKSIKDSKKVIHFDVKTTDKILNNENNDNDDDDNNNQIIQEEHSQQNENTSDYEQNQEQQEQQYQQQQEEQEIVIEEQNFDQETQNTEKDINI